LWAKALAQPGVFAGRACAHFPINGHDSALGEPSAAILRRQPGRRTWLRRGTNTQSGLPVLGALARSVGLESAERPSMPPDRSAGNVPWPVAVSFLIEPLPELFSLVDVYAIAHPLRRAFPNNRHVEAKIRQSLQILRDRGQIAFEKAGHYRKVQSKARHSVRLDFSEYAQYASRSQVARVAVEAWVASNVGCWRCPSSLVLVPANTQLLDAVCRQSGHEVQIKAVSGIAKDRLAGAAFGPMARRLEDRALPDYLVVSYDRPRRVVVLAEFIEGAALVANRLKPRAALGPGARRAGWIGATVDLTGIDRRVVVGPSFEPEVRAWS